MPRGDIEDEAEKNIGQADLLVLDNQKKDETGNLIDKIPGCAKENEEKDMDFDGTKRNILEGDKKARYFNKF